MAESPDHPEVPPPAELAGQPFRFEAATTAPEASVRDLPPRMIVEDTDIWAHRRGEPRLFAFLWSLYILVAVMGSILWLARLPIVTASTYSPAARTLLVVLAAGITVLWPMTRLSQMAPERDAVGAMLADLLVIQLPVQLVIWPMSFLANWPVRVVGAVALLFLAWGLLTGGMLALAFAGAARGRNRTRNLAGQLPRPVTRGIWMAACILAVVAAPAAAMVLSNVGQTAKFWLDALDMASPFTAVFAISGTGWSGPTTAVQRPQWLIVWLTACVGVVCWLWAARRQSRGD